MGELMALAVEGTKDHLHLICVYEEVNCDMENRASCNVRSALY